MKTSYLFFTLSLGVVVGCGSAPGGSSGNGGSSSSSDVASDSAALTDTVTESADLASSMGEDDMTMAAGGFGGVTDDMSDRHTAIVGAVLRAAIDPHACAAGSASITIAPMKTASCADIGLKGQYPGGATLSFAKCVLRDGAVLDGSVVLDETRDLAAGQTCGPMAVVDVTRSLTIDSLTFTAADKAELAYTKVSASVLSEHALGARPTSVESKQSGERKITDAKGTVVLDQSFDSDVTVTFTAKSATAPASRTINGMSTVVHHVAGFTAALTIKGVELTRTCCKPIAGSITWSKTPTSGTATTQTVEFGPMCGDLTVDGKAVTVPECL